jgi:chitin disaccharide deacetylase
MSLAILAEPLNHICSEIPGRLNIFTTGTDMIIVNADDWGRSRDDTNATQSCYEAGRITSVSAMVFMDDSERAADLAKEMGMDVGLHLNLSQRFSGTCRDSSLLRRHERITSFLTRSRYAVVLYNPALRQDFDYAYQAQLAEFHRLYGARPSHVDGHQHKHLCANMLFDKVIPKGEKVRRNLSFYYGEKGVVNRMCRDLVDHWLSLRYRLTDYFFDLPLPEDLPGIAALSTGGAVEIMAHPVRTDEYAFLMSDQYLKTLLRHETGTHSSLPHKEG